MTQFRTSGLRQLAHWSWLVVLILSSASAAARADAKAMLQPSAAVSAAAGAQQRMFEVLGVCRKALRKSEQDVADATRKALEYLSRLRRLSGGLNL
jgi:hypothetical protein